MSTKAPTSGKTKTLPYDIFRFVTPPLQTPYGQGLAYISPEKIKSGIQNMAGLITDFLPNEAPNPGVPSSSKYSKRRMWRLLTAMFVQRGGTVKGAKLSFSGKLYAKDSLLISTFRSIARLASTTQPQKGTQRLLLLGASLYKHSCLKGPLSPITGPTVRGTALTIAFFLCTNIGGNFGHFSPHMGQQPEGSR